MLSPSRVRRHSVVVCGAERRRANLPHIVCAWGFRSHQAGRYLYSPAFFLDGINHYRLTDMEVQIFGVKKSADTRKALRFFSERRVRTHFVDLMEREISDGELQRFVQRFGLDALIDRNS